MPTSRESVTLTLILVHLDCLICKLSHGDWKESKTRPRGDHVVACILQASCRVLMLNVPALSPISSPPITTSQKNNILFCDMGDQSRPPHLRAMFESALQDYQKQTRTTLIGHPIFNQLQSCDSVKSVTAVLQGQARTFSESQGHGRITKPLEPIVAVLYTHSASTALGEVIGLVRRDIVRCPMSLISSFSHTHLQQQYLPLWLSSSR